MEDGIPGDDTASFETLRSLDRMTKSLTGSADAFGRSLTNALAKSIVEGRRLDDVLRNVGRTLSESLLKTALKPLSSLVTGTLGSLVQGLTGSLTGALGLGGLGSLFGGGGAPLQMFASGGVVAAPTYFPTGRGLGLMGEAGAEAIMPLARGPDGRLGVRGGAGGSARPVAVNVQVSTPDAESFRRSEAQVSAAIARAVARGGRAL